MLIQFSVKNWRSIRDEQTLVMLQAKGDELLESNTFESPQPSSTRLLRSAVIYGANAAGKTNVIRAAAAMRDVVIARSGSASSIQYDPFFFDDENDSLPVEFEVAIIVSGVRYVYGFTSDDECIYSEWLIAYPHGRPQKWFVRELQETGDYDWSFGSSLVGNKKVWQDSTREDSLFLSTAVSLNSKQLEPIYNWFKNNLKVSTINGFGARFSARKCIDSSGKAEVLDFLRAADLDIHDLEVEEEKFGAEHLPENLPAEVKSHIIESAKDRDFYSVRTVHVNNDGGTAVLEMLDESNGTQKVFEFAGPWLDVLKNGRVLFVDELNDSLHPEIVRFLVGFFNNSELNPKNAQLIFTTHETSILRQDTFRRDQIWFCEKDDDQATQLYPLTDFSPRKGRENLEEAYLGGRYGALPYVKTFSYR